MANFLSRIMPWKSKHVDGTGWWLPVTGGWLPPEAGGNWNWWQMGYDVVSSRNCSAMVEACVSAYSQTVAMCPGDHWRLNEKGGRDRITSSALSRILRRPNNYQSISDFLLNATRSLYVDGNAYALALRNDRFEISELHLMDPRQSSGQIAVTGDVFYSLGGNEIIERRIQEPLMVPARDVLHVRLHTTRHPLRGESPIVAAALDIAASSAITRQQIAFYVNQARPSTVLTTDMVLTKDQVTALRQRWNEQSQGLNAGGTPILSAGLKPMTLATSAADAELAEIMKLTEQHIALAFRLPLQILGIGETPFASTEALMQFWLSSGLGFCLNHIEESFGQLFGLRGQPEEYVEFNTKALLRSAFKDRIEGLVRGAQGGIYSPNEARLEEGLPTVAFGDEPRVQQQVVPLSAASGIPATPAAPSAPTPEDNDGDDAERGVANDYEQLRRRFRASNAQHLLAV